MYSAIPHRKAAHSWKMIIKYRSIIGATTALWVVTCYMIFHKKNHLNRIKLNFWVVLCYSILIECKLNSCFFVVVNPDLTYLYGNSFQYVTWVACIYLLNEICSQFTYGFLWVFKYVFWFSYGIPIVYQFSIQFTIQLEIEFNTNWYHGSNSPFLLVKK